MQELTNIFNYIGTIVANVTLNVVVLGIIIYIAIWFIREIYYWAKYHIMGLFKENEWNQYRRR